jgi:ABC-type dipeptide/oligopeptide/nickel transport system ATPase component
VSFEIGAAETYVLVGESGSGKSMTAAAIMNIVDTPPASISAGEIRFRGQELTSYRTLLAAVSAAGRSR